MTQTPVLSFFEKTDNWVLSLSFFQKIFIFTFSLLSCCQRQQLDSNPKPWDDEARPLPLNYCRQSVVKGSYFDLVTLCSAT
jgi:hypothetical protein